MAERRAISKQMARRYAKASKAEKGRMLDELCALTGWTRRHARRALARAVQPPAERTRRPRSRIYGPEVLEPLRFVWATLNGPSGKRLAPFMAEVVAAPRHFVLIVVVDELEPDFGPIWLVPSKEFERMTSPNAEGNRRFSASFAGGGKWANYRHRKSELTRELLSQLRLLRQGTKRGAPKRRSPLSGAPTLGNP